MRLADIIAQSVEKLKTSDIDSAPLDARLLICHALELDRAALLSQSQRVLEDTEISAINTFIAERQSHKSVARIIGSREFWGLNFGLNEGTLEPRPDSETLIEAVLPLAKKSARILDLGTGTGCLLLSLLHERPDASGVGADLNPLAVTQAAHNAAALGLSDRAIFLKSNWLENVDGTFDVIVSNPPYIPFSDLLTLMPEVRNYDPALALDGGADGLVPYRFLIPRLKAFLNPQGIVAFEVGIGQGQQVADLLRHAGFTDIQTRKDIGGIERCVSARISD